MANTYVLLEVLTASLLWIGLLHRWITNAQTLPGEPEEPLAHFGLRISSIFLTLFLPSLALVFLGYWGAIAVSIGLYLTYSLHGVSEALRPTSILAGYPYAPFYPAVSQRFNPSPTQWWRALLRSRRERDVADLLIDSDEAEETHRLVHHLLSYAERSRAYLVLDEVVEPSRQDDGTWTVPLRARTPGGTPIPMPVLDEFLRRAMEDPHFGQGLVTRCALWDADVTRYANWAMLVAIALLYVTGHLAWLMTPWAALGAGVWIAFGQMAGYLRQRQLMPTGKPPQRYSIQLEAPGKGGPRDAYTIRFFFAQAS